jgi:hypothetical protein
LFQVSRIRSDSGEIRSQNRDQIHLRADESAEHDTHARHERIEIDGGRLQHLLAAEREQLLGQFRCPLARFDDLFHVGATRILRSQRFDHKAGVNENRCQKVIEVVGHPASQLSDGFHLLRLAQLCFERLSLADVRSDT